MSKETPMSDRAPAMPAEDIIKNDTAHLEKTISESKGDYAVVKPESLRHLSDEDIKTLETKMVRKMDMVYGIMDDLNMNTSDFATAISILFVGYLPFQIPSNLIMTKITRPGLYICVAATIWGSVSACTAAVKTYKSLLAVRVILGITEAVFFPGVIYFLSAWYTKNELGKRLAALFMFQMIGSAFGGLVAAACLTLDGRYGIAGWRWLFIVEGTVTVGVGIISSMLMPEYPHNARLLKPVERDYAVWRLEMEAGDGEAHEDTTTWGGFKLAILDPKVWVLVWAMGMGQAMGSIVNFFPSIVETLGYGKIQSLLLTAPPYLLAALVFYCISYISDRKNTMYPIIAGSLVVAFVAYIIALSTLLTPLRYFAMMLMPSACSGPQIMLYKTLNVHMARPYPKRAAGVAMMNSIGGLSNVWTSYLYYSAPHYYAAFGTLLGCAVSFLVTMTGYLFHVRRINRLLGGTQEDQRKALKSGVTQQQIDLNWRYIGY